MPDGIIFQPPYHGMSRNRRDLAYWACKGNPGKSVSALAQFLVYTVITSLAYVIGIRLIPQDRWRNVSLLGKIGTVLLFMSALSQAVNASHLVPEYAGVLWAVSVLLTLIGTWLILRNVYR